MTQIEIFIWKDTSIFLSCPHVHWSDILSLSRSFSVFPAFNSRTIIVNVRAFKFSSLRKKKSKSKWEYNIVCNIESRQQAANMMIKDPMRHKFRPWCDFGKSSITIRSMVFMKWISVLELDPKTGLTQAKLIANLNWKRLEIDKIAGKKSE